MSIAVIHPRKDARETKPGSLDLPNKSIVYRRCHSYSRGAMQAHYPNHRPMWHVEKWKTNLMKPQTQTPRRRYLKLMSAIFRQEKQLSAQNFESQARIGRIRQETKYLPGHKLTIHNAYLRLCSKLRPLITITSDSVTSCAL